MKCFWDIDYNLLTSIIALGMAFIALHVSYKAVRYQIIALLNVQLSDKAKDCNNYLDPKNLSLFPKQNDKFSGIVSAIITAEEILNYQTCLNISKIIKCKNIQSLVDQFYLQLHTTIRKFLQKGQIDQNDIESKDQFDQLQSQYLRSVEFLTISISQDKNNIYEQLHSCSLKRNKYLEKKSKSSLI